MKNEEKIKEENENPVVCPHCRGNGRTTECCNEEYQYESTPVGTFRICQRCRSLNPGTEVCLMCLGHGKPNNN